jgi:hypothetical protein
MLAQRDEDGAVELAREAPFRSDFATTSNFHGAVAKVVAAPSGRAIQFVCISRITSDQAMSS